jgi:hypothetical protein
VYVWLGSAREESDIAVSRIQGFPSKTRRKNRRPIWSYGEGSAILNLFSRKYWRRVWIIQEILLAQNITVLCGSKEFPWSCIESLSAELDEIEESRIYHHPFAASVRESDAIKLYHQRRSWTKLPPSERSIELWKLLEAHNDIECTDIRDRIFGFLGLIPSTNIPSSPSFVADYSISALELFKYTVNYFSSHLPYTAEHGSNISQLRNYAYLLQSILKLNHLKELVEEELKCYIMSDSSSGFELQNDSYTNFQPCPPMNSQIYRERSSISMYTSTLLLELLPDPTIQSHEYFIPHKHRISLYKGQRSSNRRSPNRQSSGRLLLDPTSLGNLSRHFDRLIESIQQRWAALYQQTRLASQISAAGPEEALSSANVEIERIQGVLRQIEELQTEWDKIKRIADIVKGFRERVEALDASI